MHNDLQRVRHGYYDTFGLAPTPFMNAGPKRTALIIICC